MLSRLRDAWRARGERAEASIKYQRALEAIAGSADPRVPREVRALAEASGLNPGELANLHGQVVHGLFSHLLEDGRLDAHEDRRLEILMAELNVSVEASGIPVDILERLRTVARIEHGVMPSAPFPGEFLQEDDDERAHFTCMAALRKWKKVRTGVSSSGTTFSFRIVKGFRYRAGSMRVSTTTEDRLAIEDTGYFSLTDRRLIFCGQKKKFSVAYGAVSAMSMSDGGLELSKRGRETPFIFTLPEYEIPVAVLAHVLS